jgi:predicted GNAT family acetyltransferase
MADFFTRVPGPLEVMRRLGLNVPSSKQLGKFSTAVPEFVGPQADVAGMVRDAGQVMPNIRSGDYGQALANLGMAAAAIPFMAIPGTVSQIKGVTKKITDDPVRIETSKRGDVLEISRIETPDNLRGQGLAEQKLQQLVNQADADGTTLALTPTDAFGAKKSKLEKWYRRHGFVPNKGRNKNWTTKESMIRPSKVGQVNRQEKIRKLREEATAQRFGEQDINTDYRMTHQPVHDDAARLDDMTGGGEVFPDDIYSSQGFSIYGGGKGDYFTANKQSYNKILKAKGNPNAEMTIYRAVPNDDSIKAINSGDFVTLSRKYADLHAGSGYGTRGIDAGKVLSKKVKVRDLFSGGNDLNEFGYFPK